MEKSAVISDCGRYRYELIRDWSNEEECFPGGQITFVMLNPSTADAFEDDPTIRKCIGFAKLNGYNRLRVVNLFAWRATDPKELKKLGFERVGPWNDYYLPEYGADVVAAWGAGFPYNHDFGRDRIAFVEQILRAKTKLMCVRKSESRPWHPLYVPYGQFKELSE